MSAGYSGTPLIKKLGIKPGMTIWLVNAPHAPTLDHYLDLLGGIPDGVTFLEGAAKSIDFIHFFTKERAEHEAQFPVLTEALAQDGMLWISWPKKASKTPTDVNGNVIRDIGLENGLVDVKVAAVDAVWSGLKFVYRVQDRT